jgi:hypothetical protein
MSLQPNPQKPRCRFDLFVRIRPGTPNRFPGLKTTWCYRGDHYTDIEAKMLRNLLSLIKNKIGEFSLLELYDNFYQKDHPMRVIVKILDGVIITNGLTRYQDLLINYPLPDFLK